MRGGVSAFKGDIEYREKSSPHAWGCFMDGYREELAESVFPTCVGVFLKIKIIFVLYKSLPHMRGGVSRKPGRRCPGCRSSPHAWGCFYLIGIVWPFATVFPTCVGVFPSRFPITSSAKRLPHMRGGVS